MIKHILSLILALFLIQTSAFSSEPQTKMTLTEFKSNKVVDASELYKKPSIVVFWASWCQDCSKNLQAIKETLDEKTIKEHVRTVCLDQDLKIANAYFSGKPQFELFKELSYLDSRLAYASSLKINGLPAVVLLDTAGKVVEKWETHLDSKQRVEMVSKLKGLIK